MILTRLSQEDHLDADSQALEFQAGPVSPTKTNIQFIHDIINQYFSTGFFELGEK